MSVARHTVFQTSLMSALVDGVYEGEFTIGELLEHGNFGLGTFNQLDGEMIVLDSICYQLRNDGTVEIASNDLKTPFAIVMTFEATITATMPDNSTRDELIAVINTLEPSQNYLYAAKVTGEFDWVTVRTVSKQTPPYKGLRDATKGEPTQRFDNVRGTVAGFRTPLYQQGIGVPGGHVHFIDDDRQRGGHVLDFVAKTSSLELCIATDLHLRLPTTAAFEHADLSPSDLAEQISAAENHR